MSGEGQRGKVDWYVKYCTGLCKCRNRQMPKQAKGGVFDRKSCAASCDYIVVGQSVKPHGQPRMRGESAFSERG